MCRGWRLIGVCGTACLLWLLTGCGRGDDWMAVPPIPEEPVQGGTLTVAVQSDGRSLDPHRVTDAAAMRLIENGYSTLMRYTATYGEVEPYLAESVTWSDDGRQYTFHLHTNVVFHHSGRRLKASDVKYSLNRILQEEVRAEQFRSIAAMTTPDPHTLVITLHEPVAPFLTYLAYPMNAVVDREVVKANDGRLDRVVAGTGPFQLVEWQRDRHLILERHPHYHLAGLPRLDRVVWRPIPDETARTTALRNGEIDLMLDVPEKDRSILERTPHVHIADVPGTFWEYIGLNTAVPPFDDVRVRQAIAWAVDREMINRIVKLGRAVSANGDFFPPNHWAYTGQDVYPDVRLAKARELLADAGYADGFRTVMRVGSAFPYQVAAAQIVKQQLLAVDIDVEIVSQESGVFFEALGQGDFEMTLVGWLGFVDPDEWFYNIFHSTGAWNQQQFGCAEVDALLEQGRRVTDRDERRALYGEIQRLILNAAPVVLLYINEQSSAMLRHVQDYQVHPTATTLSLRETWVIR